MKRDQLPPDLNLPPTCEQSRVSLTDYLDGAMTPAEARALEGHLEECRPCRAYFDDLRRTITLVGQLRGAQLPPEITGSPDQARRPRGLEEPSESLARSPSNNSVGRS